MPGFVDSHTHLVFAGDRGDEFAARMAGAPYAAGGIRVTTDATREATDAELAALAARRRDEALHAGITHLEIKSGYGLDVATEERLCRLAAGLTDDVTFLGAHVVPMEYEGRADDYVDLVVTDMLAACAPHARWIDVFCERGAFDADQARAVLTAGRQAGLGLRVHANQLEPGPGVRLAVELGAASADHCTHLTDADVEALAGGDTVATPSPTVVRKAERDYPSCPEAVGGSAIIRGGPMFRSRSRGGAMSVALVAVALLAGCGSSDSSSTSSSASTATAVDKKVAALVPAAVKSKGTLTVAADASYPPNEFIGSDGKTVEGMDADLAKALAGAMGLKAKVVNASFDGIIPGLAAKKYDLGMSSFTDTKEREKTVDFVTYFSAGTSFYVKAQGGPTINTLADLCGHKVAAEKGTTQADGATAQGKKCKAQGKAGVTVSVFPDQNGANLALSSGRSDVGMADSPVAAYQVKKSNGQFKLVGKSYGTAPYGIAITKGTGLDKPVLAGMKALVANGSYKAILDKWGIASGAITNPQLNGATS